MIRIPKVYPELLDYLQTVWAPAGWAEQFVESHGDAASFHYYRGQYAMFQQLTTIYEQQTGIKYVFQQRSPSNTTLAPSPGTSGKIRSGGEGVFGGV